MTKTITELQPLIYASLFAQPERRKSRRRQWMQTMRVTAPVLYAALGLKIATDTGLPPWDWRFWVMFAPLFLGVEYGVRHFAPGVRNADAEVIA